MSTRISSSRVNSGAAACGGTPPSSMPSQDRLRAEDADAVPVTGCKAYRYKLDCVHIRPIPQYCKWSCACSCLLAGRSSLFGKSLISGRPSYSRMRTLAKPSRIRTLAKPKQYYNLLGAIGTSGKRRATTHISGTCREAGLRSKFKRKTLVVFNFGFRLKNLIPTVIST